MTWQDFVVAHGYRVRLDHLVHLLQQPAGAITRLRHSGVCVHGAPRDFAALFALWNGRPPADEDWPRPRRLHRRGQYEWQTPEVQLLASLVGRMGSTEIAEVLTKRLQRLTGDPTAARSRNAVQVRTNLIGLEVGDVVGGMSMKEAARIVGSRSILDHEIRAGKIRTFRVGRLVVIPYDEFDRWKGTRVFPPAGYVKLTKLKTALGIRSDKLSEWARQGRVPSAIRCNPSGTGEKNTQFGTWYIDPKVASKILADRRAGRPMPWWGLGDPANLRVTYRLWQQRQHPDRCVTCRHIWGPAGPPRTFEDYTERYPPIAHGAKRHLTRPYSDGLTLDQVSAHAHLSVSQIKRAIQNGILRAARIGASWYVSQTDATRWKARKCPTGDRAASWLSIPLACKLHSFTPHELQQHIDAGRLTHRIGEFGAQRGIHLVSRQQCSELRAGLGYSEGEAAARVGVSVARLRVLLRGLQWRPAPRIPLEVVKACIKRKYSQEGATIAEVAQILGKTVAWVQHQIKTGTARVARTKWNIHRRYISRPMFKRLATAALDRRRRQPKLTREWLHVGPAAHLAAVSIATIAQWANDGVVKTKPSPTGRRFHRRSVITKARRYWLTEARRYKRPRYPDWLQQELHQREDGTAA